ncbi:hypothetical protein AALP_AA6G169100 [Arabis alpina]|uniref:Uncharacterized protein n=1 Tax=Arabis alpina TaxID=50452 RepID=A0A087GPR6_ARAAL|nr:hypothetical protein AALP_AA6G169100 [Arabis alpina]
MSSAAQEADEISVDGQGSDDDEDQQEEENSCIPFEDNLETDSDQNMDEELTQNISFVEASIEIQPECNFRAIVNVNGQATLDEETPSMSLVADLTEIQQECRSGAIEDITGDEAKLDLTTSMQKLQVITTRAGKSKVINGDGYNLLFIF